VRALLAQVDAPDTPQQGVERVRAAAESDAALGLVAFPELYLSGYDLGAAPGAAIGIDDEPVEDLRELARETETALAVGFAERWGERLGNSLALIDERGELAGVYRKTHLFGEEVEVFDPGDELLVTELAGVRVGSLVCFDMEFPETARALARAGAQLLLTASANMEPYFEDHRIASQARALDNRLPHLYVNRCGQQAGLLFVGGTRAVRGDGSVVAATAGDGEELLTVDVDLTPVGDHRIDYLAHVREDLRAIEPTPTGGTKR
jgi:predicted amidohydrolase